MRAIRIPEVWSARWFASIYEAIMAAIEAGGSASDIDGGTP